MRTLKIVFVGAAAALALTACDDGTTETGDTGMVCDGIAVELTEIYADCAGGEWSYWGTTEGLVASAEIEIMQTGVDPQYAWDEHHSLVSVDEDTTDCNDKVARDLPIVTDYAQQEEDVNTLFQCNEDRKSTLTWMMTVTDVDDNTDCAVWGDDPSYFDTYNCLNWN